MLYFQNLEVFSHNNPDAESYTYILSSVVIQHGIRVTLLPQGYYEQKPINLEKTTSSVLSVLLLICETGM